MLADTTDARRGERKAAPLFDMAVPHIKRAAMEGGSGGMSNGDYAAEGASKQSSGMQFSLLSKRGNKQQVSDIESSFVSNRR